MWKKELDVEDLLVVSLSLAYSCLGIVVWLLLAVPWVCLPFVIVVFPGHTRLLFLNALGRLLEVAVLYRRSK